MTTRPRWPLATLVVSLLLVSCGSAEREVPRGLGALGPGSWTGARTSHDGRHLLVTFTGGPEYADGNPCSVRYQPVTRETAKRVAVRIDATSPAGPPGLACTLEGHARVVEVALDQALGRRQLFEDRFQRRQPVFPGETLLEPTWLPDGWSLRGERAGAPDPDSATFWTRDWAPPRPAPSADRCTPGQAGLSLTQGPAGVVERYRNGEVVRNTPDVGGSEAVYAASDDGGTARLSWVQGGQSFVITTTRGCLGDSPATEDTLLRFARGLR